MGTDRLTLLDHAKRLDPDGKVAKIVELLDQTNPIFQDAPAFPSNAEQGNRVTIRSSLPVVGFGKVNQGVTRSKGSTEQRLDSMGLIVGLSEVDTKLKKIIGEAKFKEHRFNEDKGFTESITQLIVLTMLYGNELTNGASWTGFMARLASLATAITGSQVRSMGSVGGGDGTSMLIVDWHEDFVHLIYPKDGDAVLGIDVQDKGEHRVNDADGNPMMAAITEYTYAGGLTVKDPRHIARVANIDVSDANLESPTQGKLMRTLIDTMTAMPRKGPATRVIYCHHTIEAAFIKQVLDKSNAALTMQDYLGRPTPHFWDSPIRRLDQFATNESTVS